MVYSMKSMNAHIIHQMIFCCFDQNLTSCPSVSLCLRPNICSNATALKMRPTEGPVFLGMPTSGPASTFWEVLPSTMAGRLEHPNKMDGKTWVKHL